MAKLKNSIFPLEQENALHVYRVEELYVSTRCWKQTHLWANRHNRHLTFSLTLTVKINVIYLTECILCKLQYVGKAETAFNLRLNDHRKDTKKPNAILAPKHCQHKGHNFNKHAKFITTDKLINLHNSKEALWEMLVRARINFSKLYCEKFK